MALNTKRRRPRRPSPSGAKRAAASAVLGLAVAREASVAAPSSGGSSSVVVRAYARARPPSRFLRPRPSSRRKGEGCIFCVDEGTDRALLHSRTWDQLRCGGAGRGPLQPPIRAVSLSMARSGDDATLNSKSAKSSNAKYHLIWSPNFWKKALVSAIALWVMQFTLQKNVAPSFGFGKMLFFNEHSSCHGAVTPAEVMRRAMPSAFVLPLLSSSCCAIQLIINALSGWGCAGFNTYLGPIRPILLPILIASTMKLLPQRSLGWTVLSLLLGFLPEIMDIMNTNRSQQWQKNKSGGSMGADLTLPAISVKLRLSVPTMGCVACVNKVDESIRKCQSAANIMEESSWLTEGTEKGGVAELSILAGTKEEVDAIAEAAVDAVKNAGFQCSILSLRVNEH